MSDRVGSSSILFILIEFNSSRQIFTSGNFYLLGIATECVGQEFLGWWAAKSKNHRCFHSVKASVMTEFVIY